MIPSPKVRRRALLCGLLLLPQIACGAGWHRIAPPVPSVLPERQQVQVWQGRHALLLHAVRLTSDAVSGIPFVQPAACDSCRVSLPHAAIDSLRTGNPPAGFWKSVGLVMGGLVVLAFVACKFSSPCQLSPD